MNSAIAFNSSSASKLMQEVVSGLPKSVDVYIVGGAVRNAMVSKYLSEQWLQRDYDQVITKNSGLYLEYLRSIGFDQESINQPNHKVMSKAVIENARDISYEDNLVFDMHIEDGTTIIDNLKNKTALSINGFAINIRDIFDDDWQDKIIELPGSISSIKQRKIILNQDGYTSDTNYFFALIRFMGKGFNPPPKTDVLKLLKTIENIEPERYARNIHKLVNYVGSKDEVIRIVDSLNIDGLDIFDEQKTRELASSL